MRDHRVRYISILILMLASLILFAAACGQSESSPTTAAVDSMVEDTTEKPDETMDKPDGAMDEQMGPTPISTKPSATATSSPSPTPEQEQEDARYYFETANDLLNAGQTLEAIEGYDTALSLDSGFVDGYFNRGLAFLQSGNLQEAIADYSKVLELTPGDAGAYFNRGLAYLQSGNLQEAIADYSKVLELDPSDVDAYFNRGLAFLQSGKLEQAVADYTKVLEFSPDNSDAYFNLAAAYYLLGEIDKFDLAAHSFGIDDLDTASLWNIYRGNPTPVSIKEDVHSMKNDAVEVSLPDEVMVPHFEDSFPAHGEVLAKVPQRVDINFKQELDMNSTIMVTLDGEPVLLGTVIISTDPWRKYLSMGVPVEGDLGDGVYEVRYSACWQEGPCNQGLIAFIVNSTSNSQ